LIHIILEWVQLVSLAFIVGVIVCRLWFFTPSMQTEFPYHGNFVPGMWRLFCFGLAFMIGGSVLGLFARSVEISGRPLSEIFSVLPVVLFKTHYGTVWLIRIGALILLALSKTAVRYRDRRSFLGFMLLLTLIVSMTASASGHASDAGDFSIPEIMDLLHLIAACLWGGGLMVLSVSVLPNLISEQEGSAPLISRVASRFSTMAGIAVGIIVLSALYHFWAYVRSAEALLGTPYGLTIAAKIIMLAILVNLGAFNRYVSVPLLQQWAGRSPGREGLISRISGAFFAPFKRNRSGYQIAGRFKRSVGVEALLIVAVLFCASMLRHEIPARHLFHMQHSHEKGASTSPSGSWPMHHQ
jgi:putative copper resistance protein D